MKATVDVLELKGTGDVVGTATQTRKEVIEEVIVEWQRLAEILLKPEENYRRQNRDKTLSEIDAMEKRMELLGDRNVAAVRNGNCELSDALWAEMRRLYHELDHAYIRLRAFMRPVKLTPEQEARRLQLSEKRRQMRESVTPEQWAGYLAEQEQWDENEYFRLFPRCV